MSLFQFTQLNKYGNPRIRIITESEKQFIEENSQFDKFFIKPFKYEFEHPYMSPFLIVKDDVKYMLPGWIKVHKNTTFDDIDIIRKKEEKVEIIEHKFKSSSSNKEYVVRQVGEKLSCSCPGFWRSKDKERGCKHIQSLKNI